MAEWIITKSLVVSGFWSGESKYGSNMNQTNEIYGGWFRNSLQINSPYLIFHGRDDDDLLKQSRNSSLLPTVFVELDESEFLTTKLAHHINHASRVWNEKLDLLLRAHSMFPHVEWFSWVDAGVNTFRETMPPKVSWPQIDLNSKYPPSLVFTRQSGVHHDMICGNMFMVHRAVLPEIHKHYYEDLKSDG